VFSTLTNYFSSTANAVAALNAERMQGAMFGDADQRIATENLYKNTRKEVYIASCINISLAIIITIIIYKKYIQFSEEADIAAKERAKKKESKKKKNKKKK
jgi:hypothetical protein